MPRAPSRTAALAALAGVGLAIAGCGGPGPKPGPRKQAAGHYKVGVPYQINGRWYYPEVDPRYDRTGLASWYGEPFHGRDTANGEVFDKDAISAAHPTLPLPSVVRVTNLDNGRSLDVRVNDRGPFIGDRLIDLSQAAAGRLGFEDDGLARVRVRFIGMADDARGIPPVGAGRAYAAADRGTTASPPPSTLPAYPPRREAVPPSASSGVPVPPIPPAASAAPATAPSRIVTTELEPTVPAPPGPGAAWPAGPVVEPRTTPPGRSAVAVARPPPPALLPARPAAPTRPSLPQPTTVCYAGPHYVQVGTFSDGARIHAATVALRGLERVVVEPYFAGGQALARMRLGPSPTRAAANAVLDRARTLGYLEASLVPAAARPVRAASC